MWHSPNTRRDHDAAHSKDMRKDWLIGVNFCVDVYMCECKLLWYEVMFVCASSECDS